MCRIVIMIKIIFLLLNNVAVKRASQLIYTHSDLLTESERFPPLGYNCRSYITHNNVTFAATIAVNNITTLKKAFFFCKDIYAHIKCVLFVTVMLFTFPRSLTITEENIVLCNTDKYFKGSQLRHQSITHIEISNFMAILCLHITNYTFLFSRDFLGKNSSDLGLPSSSCQKR